MLISSHKPKRVEAIKDGSKTCLLFSRTPTSGCQPGDWQAIWTTSPVSAIECVVRVRWMQSLINNVGLLPQDNPLLATSALSLKCGLSNRDLRDFIVRSPSPCAVWIDRVEMLEEPRFLRETMMEFGLDLLWRKVEPNKLWRPPQTFRYLSTPQVADLTLWTDARMNIRRDS